MRSGRFDRRITLQRRVVAISTSGVPTETWSTTVVRRPASMLPVSADERFDAPLVGATEQIEFSIRYSLDVMDLSPLWRIIYPALDDGDDTDPLPRTIHDIVAVNEIGRRKGLKIIAVRRPDELTHAILLVGDGIYLDIGGGIALEIY